ncbi:MAG: GIY-YIG nuclease family protein [Pseudomonadota bacterium]
MSKPGYVYLMANRKNGTLYIGVTSDLPRRVWQHREGRGSIFVRQWGCTMLVWYDEFPTITEALVHEKRMKKWARRMKIEEIEKMNQDWRDLWHDLGGWTD